MKKFLGFIVVLGVVVATYFALDSYKLKGNESHSETKLYPAEQQSQLTAESGSVATYPTEKPAAVKAEPAKEAPAQVAPVAPKEEKKAEPVAPKQEEAKKVEPKKEVATADHFDKKMKEYGLVDIKTLDKEIGVELKYATTDNFVGKNMYGSLTRAYLVPSFAKRVINAQKILRKRFPKYNLHIYDAARPISVQRTMRRMVEGTPMQDFVADGTRGGRHNYGVAVDLTITNEKGEPLDMGTGFDALENASAVKGTSDTSDPATRTIEVYRAYISKLEAQGVISKKAADNRILLIEVMHEAGLYPYRREWWHFELIESMSTIRSTYRLLDF